MFNIEVMNLKSCPIRCPTCPKSIQQPTGPHADKIAIGYQLLKKKLGSTPHTLGLTDDFANVFKQFDLLGVETISDLYMDISSVYNIDTVKYRAVATELVQHFPKIKLALGFLNKELGVYSDKVDTVIGFGKLFMETGVINSQVSITDNSMPLAIFKKESTSLILGDISMHQKIEQAFGVHPGSLYTNFKTGKDPTYHNYTYHSSCSVFNKATSFSVVRRVIAQTGISAEDSMAYHRIMAQAMVDRGTPFLPHSMSITLTNIGVCICHDPRRIESPYLWMSYNELFEHLEKSEHIQEFCFRIQSMVRRTLGIRVDDITTITSETIQTLAHRRKHFSDYLLHPMIDQFMKH